MIDKPAKKRHSKTNELNRLFNACYSGHLCIVEEFKNFNLKNYRQITPLLEAARGDRLNILEFLLTQQIDVNVVDLDNWTALHYTRSSSDIVKLLLHHDVIPNVRSKGDFTPLSLNYRERYDRIMYILPEDHNVQRIDDLKLIDNLFVEEYSRYIMKVKSILKYIGLENIYYLVRQIIEFDVGNDQIVNVVYQ